LPALDAVEIAKLLTPLAEAVGQALAVDDRNGNEVVAAGDGHAGPAKAPIVVRAEPIGSVRAQQEAVARGAARLLSEVLGRRQYLELELESMADELLERYEEVTLLHGLARALGSVFDVPSVSQIALEKALQVIAAERALVAVVDEGSAALVVTAASGSEGLVGTTLPARGIGAGVVATGKRVILHDDELWRQGDLPERRPGDAMLSVPLLLTAADGDETAIGVLVLAGREAGERFSAGDASLASAVAFQLAGTIHTSRTVQRLAAAENLRREVEIAAGIQRSLLPETPPLVPGARLGARCAPADNVGGDLYDLVIDGDGRLVLLIADVAGHGIGSGLMMAMARAILRVEIADGKGPAAVLAATNTALFDDLANAGLFITLFCASYEPGSRSLVYACGGHNPPLLCTAAGALSELQADGMPAGILRDVEFEERRVTLAAGDVVVLFTDGVVEARTGSGEQFGEERLHAVVAAGRGAPPDELIAQIVAAVVRHTAGAPPKDDSTLVVLAIDRAETGE
jgi:serine phosphatase RsbU (regulator of sigma subunit)